MYQVTGWFVVRASPGDTELAEEGRVHREIAELVGGFGWAGHFQMKVVNGEGFVTVATLTNHRGGEAADLELFLRELCRVAPGSYGLLHEWDDETAEWPGENAFKVYVLARGRVTVREDPFFSPLVPTIEDPYDPTA
ncbi:Imm7 family immunity protein [Thermomonospora amylolytica]|uniref:Imm7 family immunity protein n=1 Tax=Thermomonospora amylolytica TaxID=1411117 RepID=UPI000E6B6FCC|nr:Imm7 family immunity protein [Thermomonospora amylolytica]